MLWLNFLHLYQPANEDAHVIKEATEKSYWRLVRALEEHPQIKFTLNITGCLILRWEELNYFDLINRFKNLVAKGQIELVGSAAYHPILPLIPKKEAITQIKENEEILKRHFGQDFKPVGFFLPELAYSREVVKIIKAIGYKWLILDEIAYNGELNKVDYNNVYQDKSCGLKIVFRNRKLSKSYVPETILKLLDFSSAKNEQEDKAVITATDAELYGLRHEDPTAEFERLLSQNDFTTLLISEFVDKYRKVEKIDPLPCSWESLEDELKQSKPYILWFDKQNALQQKLWKLANLAYDTIEENSRDKNYHWARWHLVRGLAGCTFWWASAKDFRLFGPISWSPDEIERGSNELIRSIRALDNVTTRKTKIRAERLYIKVKQMIWQKHWTYYWKK